MADGKAAEADTGPVAPIDADLKKKQAGKYSNEREAEAQGWIEAVTGESVGDNFQEGLKSGVILCNLINKLKPGTIKKISKAKTPFVQMENINIFLTACTSQFGMSDVDTFATKDLYESDNLGSVVDTIFSLGSRAQKIDGYDGPKLGAAHSEKNKREFTSEQMAKGKYTMSKQTSGSFGYQPKLGEGTDAIKRYGKKDEMGKFEHSGATQQTRGDHGYQPSLEEHGDKIKRYGKKDEMGKSEHSGPTGQTAGSFGYQVPLDQNMDAIKRLDESESQATRGPTRQTAGSHGYQVELGEGVDSIKRYGKDDEMGKSEHSGATRQTAGSHGYQVPLDSNMDSIIKTDESGDTNTPSRQTQGSFGYQPEMEKHTDSILRGNMDLPSPSNQPSQQTQGSFGFEDKRDYTKLDSIVRSTEELEVDKAKAKARTDVAGADGDGGADA